MCYKEEKTTFFLRIPFIWAIFYRLMKMVGRVGRKRKEKVWFRNNIFLFQVSETFGNLEINFSIKLNALNDQLSVQCSIKRSFSKSAQSLGKHFLSAQVRALFKQKGKSILVINFSKYFETNVLILVKNLLGVFFFFFFLILFYPIRTSACPKAFLLQLTLRALIFLSGFPFTNIYDSQDSRGRGGYLFNSSLSLPLTSQVVRH